MRSTASTTRASVGRPRWTARRLSLACRSGVKDISNPLLVTRKSIVFVIAGVCALTSGCRDASTIWTAEARSPNGYWLATASTEQYGGPGTAAILTNVYLKRTNVSDRLQDRTSATTKPTPGER